MQSHRIPQFKIDAIRSSYIEGKLSARQTAKKVHVTPTTAYRYFKEFDVIKSDFPERLGDTDFFMPRTIRPHRTTALYSELMMTLPELLQRERPGIKAFTAWEKYRNLCPLGYQYNSFKEIYKQWIKEHPDVKAPALINHISKTDLQILHKWRRGNNHRQWQIAVTLQAALNGWRVIQIMEKADCSRVAVNTWISKYRLKGIKGFYRPSYRPHEALVKRIKARNDNLIKILHETPKAYGINRTSWTILALTEVYNRCHEQEPVSYRQISHSLKVMGFTYKKSRDMLTSQDPEFRQKINHIQRILQRLKPDEKFFSIDEYGPVSIRIKGGRRIKHINDSPDIVPEKQKSKGFIICTAALELSTNQVSHFYSQKKNTFEMIKLLELLTGKYADERTLYLCWDAVSWHNSKILKMYIEDYNNGGKPVIKLAPLPSCTQFLNVIESVFCGLAKAVIHNSNYANTDECKAAIDAHFRDRNAYFKANPRHAGRKIWGKEHVKAHFSETQHTRNRKGMRGARIPD